MSSASIQTGYNLAVLPPPTFTRFGEVPLVKYKTPSNTPFAPSTCGFFAFRQSKQKLVTLGTRNQGKKTTQNEGRSSISKSTNTTSPIFAVCMQHGVFILFKRVSIPIQAAPSGPPPCGFSAYSINGRQIKPADPVPFAASSFSGCYSCGKKMEGGRVGWLCRWERGS